MHWYKNTFIYLFTESYIIILTYSLKGTWLSIKSIWGTFTSDYKLLYYLLQHLMLHKGSDLYIVDIHAKLLFQDVILQCHISNIRYFLQMLALLCNWASRMCLHATKICYTKRKRTHSRHNATLTPGIMRYSPPAWCHTHPRHNKPVDISHDVIIRLWCIGGFLWHQRSEVARWDIGQHSPVGM